MKKAYILVLVAVIIVIILFALRGNDNKGPIIETLGSPTSEATSDKNEPSSSRDTEESMVLSDASSWPAYNNMHEGYTVKINPMWWWQRFNAVEGAVSVAVFNTSPIAGVMTGHPISITTTNNVQKASDTRVVREMNGMYYVIEFAGDQNQRAIFDAMVASFEFTD